MRKNEGYIPPEDVNPAGDICIRVYVPDDPLYIAAFWGGYEYYANWMAWKRDSVRSGKDAAARWRTSFDRARTEYIYSGGDCGTMDIRQKPGAPCIIQKDDGGVWEDTVDLRLCVPKMRIFNGVLQQDTTGSGNWVDASEVPYVPNTDAPAPPPWEDPPVGQTGDCLSAANVATYVDFVAYHFASSMVDGLTFFQTLSAAMVILAALIDLIPLATLTALIAALYTQVVDAWADVRDFSIIAKLSELMVCKYNADGSMTEEQWEELIADCEEWRATLTDNDQRTKWWIAIQVMTLWGPVGMTISGKIWGIVEYDCEYNECEWEKIFNWPTSADGWVNVYDELYTPPEFGAFVTGSGWGDEYVTWGPPCYNWAWGGYVDISCSETILNSIDFEMLIPTIYPNEGLTLYYKNTSDTWVKLSDFAQLQGQNHYTLSGLTTTIRGLRLGWSASVNECQPGPPTHDRLWAVSFIARGQGEYPF